MKIDLFHSQPVTREPGVPTVSKPQEASSSSSLSSSATDEDSASISSIGSLVNKLQTSSKSRIQELRRQVREGTYSADAAQLSRKLVDSMLAE